MYKYNFDAESCWYKNVCNYYKTDKCNNNCIRYNEMYYLMENSNIPKAKQFKNKLIPLPEDVENFQFLNNIKKDILNFVHEGENLYIYSAEFGNGKTTWAIKLMQAYFDKCWLGNGFRIRGLFIHVPTFLTKCKDVISNKDNEFEELKQNLLTVDLVIWDDIATGKLSEFDHNNLLTYIDQRKLNGKSNIFTGNLNEKELTTAVGNRLKSRVWNDSSIVEIYGKDRRVDR